MIRVFLGFLAGIAGLVFGASATIFGLSHGAPLVVSHVGLWEFSSRAGAPDNDPYTRARQSLEGELPLSAGEGFAFRARRDGEGNALRRECRYRLSGPLPIARFWSLAVVDERGQRIPNLANRHGFTSSEILRRQDGGFSIEIGPQALPGNWVPTGTLTGSFEVVLRFYDTPLSASATVFDARHTPQLDALGCER